VDRNQFLIHLPADGGAHHDVDHLALNSLLMQPCNGQLDLPLIDDPEIRAVSGILLVPALPFQPLREA
jgi:hypothetical protein